MKLFQLFPKLIQAIASLFLISITSRYLSGTEFIIFSLITLVFYAVASFDLGVNSRIVNKSLIRLQREKTKNKDIEIEVFLIELIVHAKTSLFALLIQIFLYLLAIVLLFKPYQGIQFFQIVFTSLLSLVFYWFGARLSTFFIVTGANQRLLILYSFGSILQTMLGFYFKGNSILFIFCILLLGVPNFLVGGYVLSKLTKYRFCQAINFATSQNLDRLNMHAQVSQFFQFLTSYAIPFLFANYLQQNTFASASILYRIFVAASSSLGAITVVAWRPLSSFIQNCESKRDLLQRSWDIAKSHIFSGLAVVLLMTIMGDKLWGLIGENYQRPSTLAWFCWAIGVITYLFFDYLKLALTICNSFKIIGALEFLRLLILVVCFNFIQIQNLLLIGILITFSYLFPSIFIFKISKFSIKPLK